MKTPTRDLRSYNGGACVDLDDRSDFLSMAWQLFFVCAHFGVAVTSHLLRKWLDIPVDATKQRLLPFATKGYDATRSLSATILQKGKLQFAACQAPNSEWSFLLFTDCMCVSRFNQPSVFTVWWDQQRHGWNRIQLVQKMSISHQVCFTPIFLIIFEPENIVSADTK